MNSEVLRVFIGQLQIKVIMKLIVFTTNLLLKQGQLLTLVITNILKTIYSKDQQVLPFHLTIL